MTSSTETLPPHTDPAPPTRFEATAQSALTHGIRSPRSLLVFAGPAVIASIAYVDPGNFATNIQAGSSLGYTLLWVVVLANLIAMLFQALSARLGIVTGTNLAELCRIHFPRPVTLTMWIASEAASMATDLAEFLGAALGLSLLLHLGMIPAMVLAAIITYAVLLLENGGFRKLEWVIAALVATISLCYLAEIIIAPPHWADALRHTVTPELPNANALTLAVGIIGATIMPHAIYLHSGLTQRRITVRNETERTRLLRFSNIETITALTIAGLVNMAMMTMAATVFHIGHSDVSEIETAWRTLIPLLGQGAALVFLISLIASGISSSVVGTMAGQVVMQGFIRRHIPIWVRRLVTMAPAFIIISLGANATTSLILSQVVLSLTLPVPMLALLIFTRRTDIMGRYAVRGPIFTLAATGATIVLLLNGVLLLQAMGLTIPGLPNT